MAIGAVPGPPGWVMTRRRTSDRGPAGEPAGRTADGQRCGHAQRCVSAFPGPQVSRVPQVCCTRRGRGSMGARAGGSSRGSFGSGQNNPARLSPNTSGRGRGWSPRAGRKGNLNALHGPPVGLLGEFPQLPRRLVQARAGHRTAAQGHPRTVQLPLRHLDDVRTPTTHHTAALTAMTSVPHRHIHVIRHVMQSTPRVAETVKEVRR
jgi:hypothetical protein